MVLRLSSQHASLGINLIFFVYCDYFCCDYWLLSNEKTDLGSINPHVYIFLYELKVFLWINSWIGNFQENSFKMF